MRHEPPIVGDRRANQADYIQDIVQKALREQSSLKKNGHSWAEYISDKWLTPQGVLLIGIFLFNAGGWWRKVDGDLSDLKAYQERTRVIEEQHKVISAAAQDTRALVKMQGDVLLKHGDALKEQSKATEGVRRQMWSLVESQRGAITRSEFNAAIRQQIKPQLDRIEKAGNP